ncbi:MAG: hypothetical protein Q9170_006896 [Blastenia crenularia]
MRGSYGQSPVGTSALGNLAHASSLEQDARNGTRDNRSLQQIIDYNRSQNRHGNSASPSYEGPTNINYGHQRPDSRGATAGPGVSYPQELVPANNYASAQNQAQSPQYVTNAAYSPTVVSAPTQSPYSSYKPISQDQRQHPYYAQAPRPSSGQSYHAGESNGQTAVRDVYQSPNLPAPPLSSGDTQTVSKLEHNALQQRQFINRRSSGPVTQTSNNRNSNPSPAPAGLSNNRNSHYSTTDSEAHRTFPEARKSVSSEEQQPTTVDPNHIFNHQEYQRRQAAAATEAATRKAAEHERIRKAAEAVEAEETRKATEAAAALKRVSESHSNVAPGTEQSREEQMAAEMRQMIEKMRDYKSKDPSLFSHIWEQVKKTQPPGSVPAGPPLSAKEIASTSPQTQGINGTFSPSPAPDSELPDLGKFPAQRRRRGAKTDSHARKRKSTSKPAESQPVPPIDPAITKDSHDSRSQVTPTSQTGSALTANGVSASQNSQVIYVSGTGPPVTRPAGSNDSQQPVNAVRPGSTGPGPAQAPPAAAQAPAPPLKSTGKTNWPEHKKWDLAIAAKNILLAMPMNAARATSISPEQVLAYLDQNPSYEQLCQMIESKGLIIERGRFARSLLEAVPGLGAGMQQPRPALANRPPENFVNSPQPNGSSLNLKFLDRNQQTPANKASVAQMTRAPSQPAALTPMSEEKPKVPLTKQEMARKGRIDDIVDLSQLSDDDDMPPPPKVPRLDEHSGNATSSPLNQEAAQTSQRTNTPQFTGGPPMYLPPAHIPTGHQYQPPVPPPTGYLSLYPYPPPPPAPAPAPSQNPLFVSPSTRQRELLNSEDIIQPIVEHKARKRTRYNPKTIVRDVLIAAGRHPSMQPLNYHLDSLRKTFKHVTDMSDLDTFRWDLVDPGEPIAPPADTRVSGDPRLIDADGNDADDEDQDMTQKPSRMALSAGPFVAIPESAEAPRKQYFSSFNAYADRMKLDKIGRPPKLLGPKRKRNPNKPNPSLDISGTSAKLSNLPQHLSTESGPRTPQPNSDGVSILGSSAGSPGIKRRGRPPGAKNKQPRKSTESHIASRPAINTTPARPSGLRSTATTDGIEVVVPSPSPSVADTQRPKRRRPKKPTPKMATSQQTMPIHRIYKCQWENCPAELHNLDTLKKHVNKHGDKFKEEGGPFPCLWKDCGARDYEEGDNEEESVLQPLRFDRHENWTKHMDKRHVAEYAWTLGDGPSVRSDSDMSDFESARRQITPIISINKGRPNPAPLASTRKSEEKYHDFNGSAADLAKAQAPLGQNQHRRESIEPGMDRGEATFVNERKRAQLDDTMGPVRKIPKDDV